MINILYSQINLFVQNNRCPTTLYPGCRSGRRFGQPRAAEITCHTLARFRTAAPQLCQSHDQVAAAIRLNHPTPTDNTRPAAHHRQPRCVPTTILSAVRRSTLERCVCAPLGRQACRSHLAMTRHDPAYRIETTNSPPTYTFL